MAAKTVRRSTRRKSTRVNPTDLVAFAFSVALAGASASALLAPSVAYANVKPDKQLLTAFAGDEVMTTAELDKQRGGFILPTGGVVNFGLEIQQMVNGIVVNTFNAGQLPAGGVDVKGASTDGLTKFETMIANNVISTVAQNTGNNRSIQTITTLNISTQGFQTALHQVTQTANIINIIHGNSWIHH